MTLIKPPPSLSATIRHPFWARLILAQASRKTRRFTRSMSLRTKLLIGFSMVFSIVFAGTFYWFYQFTTDKTLTRLQEDMEATLKGAAAGVNVDELMELYADAINNPEAFINEEGFSDDPRYLNQLKWFETVHSIEPRAWLYSYIIRREGDIFWTGQKTDQPRSPEMVFLVDLWANHNPDNAAPFLTKVEQPGRPIWAVVNDEIQINNTIYTDEWGAWISAFAPLRDENGNVVAALGLDIEADYVLQVQEAIKNRVLFSFGITYGVLFVLIYALSGILTRNLTKFTESAEKSGQAITTALNFHHHDSVHFQMRWIG